jgi:hypothetical protein
VPALALKTALERYSRDRADQDLAGTAGFVAGVVTFLLVLLPAGLCAWYASANLAGVPEAAGGPAASSGGAAWFLATALLLALPVAVGLVAGRRYARTGWALLGALGGLGALVLLALAPAL